MAEDGSNPVRNHDKWKKKIYYSQAKVLERLSQSLIEYHQEVTSYQAEW
ncbi:hypothetical protein [Desulforhabdus sp. TSK]|nr:hypothetical protein [Desulforhabdus sp. TSK]GKT10383.1 hypothetical protein DSTSK_36880 [Desulforhabdus sp. TSK]